MERLSSTARWVVVSLVITQILPAMIATPAVAAAPGAPAIWSVLESPNNDIAPAILSAVSCLSVTDCWAVGNTQHGGTVVNTVIEHWDGTEWQVVPSPNVGSGDEANLVEDVTCNSASDCWAVGYTFTMMSFQVAPLILHWDGATWSIVPLEDHSSGWSRLNGVACASATRCWSVGSDTQSGDVTGLVAEWDGARWTTRQLPDVGAPLSRLMGITCAPDLCWAVGSSGASSATEAPLALRWQGSDWSAVATPNPTATSQQYLTDISCPTVSICHATGSSLDGAVHRPFVLGWNDGTWSEGVVVDVPSDTGYDLSDVACASSTDCWSVGSALDPNGGERPAALKFNGTAWTPTLSPTLLAPTYATELLGVACVSGSSCWAVGSMMPAGIHRPFTVQWDGVTWTDVPAPSGFTTSSNMLRGMTCVSTTDCWAVGMSFSSSLAMSLILHWDGLTWSIVPSPNTALDRNNYLGDIHCVSSSDCWAVGNSASTMGTENQPLILRWDGSTWSSVPVQLAETSAVQSLALTSIDCASATDCWVVGWMEDATFRGLLVRWDGVSWVEMIPPHSGLQNEPNALYAVTCTASDACFAVGDHWLGNAGPFGAYQTVILQWGGSQWIVLPSPNTAPDQSNRLFSVACPTASDCWAVGTADRPEEDKSLFLRWNGLVWTEHDGPTTQRFPYDVTCATATDCWAAGAPWVVTPGTPPRPYLSHWDGQTWTNVEAPATSLIGNFAGIACASDATCMAVGSQQINSKYRTLTVQMVRNTAPTLSPLADISLVEARTQIAIVTATDADGDALTLTATGPTWTNFEDLGGGQGQLTLAPPSGTTGTHVITIAASDGIETASRDVTVHVITDQPPSITPIADVNLDETRTVQIAVVATDPNGDAVSLAATLPPWGAFTDLGNGEGRVTLTPPAGASGVHTLTLDATAAGLSTTRSWNVHVAPLVDLALARATGASQTSPGETVHLVASLTNLGTGTDTIDVTATSLPGWSLAWSADPTLGPGATTTVEASVIAPAAGGSTSVTLRACSTAKATTCRTLTWYVSTPLIATLDAPSTTPVSAPVDVVASVRWLNGAPASGAQLLLTQQAAQAGSVLRSEHTATTNAEGRFAFTIEDPTAKLPGDHALHVVASRGASAGAAQARYEVTLA